MNRRQAVKKIMDTLDKELVIASTGMTSREVFTYKDRPENLYITGSMGSSLGIGIGLALNTKKKVIVIAGDGDILMNLGTLVLMNKLKLPNLNLFILDNNAFSSTGGQSTCSDAVDFTKIADCFVYQITPEKGDAKRIDISYKDMTERFRNAVNKKAD